MGEGRRVAAVSWEAGSAAGAGVQTTGAGFLADTIARAGARAVFFVPTFLYPTLIELGARQVKRVLCHTEQAAAYMADGYAQAAGRPGVVIAQGGPGATNLAAGLADAWQSHTPVLALTPVMPDDRYQADAYQEVYAAFGNVTKYDGAVRNLDRLPEFLGKAFRQMTTGAPRPAHLALASSIEEAEAELDSAYLDERFFSYPAFRPRADEDLVNQAVAALQAAEQPILVCGRGALASGAWAEITELAEGLHIPVATTLGGKGSIDERHPLACGVTGIYRRPITDDLVGSADLVFYVGCHAGGAATQNRRLPRPGTRIIHLDIQPAQPGWNYPNVLPLVGDARAVLRQLTEAAGGDGGGRSRHRTWVERAQAARTRWYRDTARRAGAATRPIRPERLAAELARVCPPDTLFVTETGYVGTWAGVYMDLPAGRNMLHCEGSLGWALPAAIGAKSAVPERPVVVVESDAGFFYHMGELETAVRNDLPVVTVIFNNRAMAFQTHLLHARWAGEPGLDSLSRFGETQFARIAQEMGAYGVRISDPGDIGPALTAALREQRPAVIDVLVDWRAVAPVSFMAGHASRSDPELSD